MRNIIIAIFALAISGCQGVDVNGIHLEFAFEPTLAEEGNAIQFVERVSEEMGGNYAGAIVIMYDDWDAIGERYAAERFMPEAPCIGGYHAGDATRLSRHVIHTVPEALAHELAHFEISHDQAPKLGSAGLSKDEFLDKADHAHSPAAGWYPSHDERIDAANDAVESIHPWEPVFCRDGYTVRGDA